MKKKILVPVLMSTALVAVGCGSNAGSGSGTSDNSGQSSNSGVLNVAFASEPEALDQSKATAEEAFTMINAFGEGLYRLDPNGKPQPAMADGMPQISADGKTYTIKLKPNVTWSDGSPVTAQDFVYSIDRTLDPNTKSEYSFMPDQWIVGANDYNSGKTKTPDKVGIKALDDHTLQIQLISPVAFFTSQLAFPVFFPEKKDFVEKYGDKFGADADKTLSNGPFILQSWQHDQSLTFVKNPKYWDAANVKLNKINFQIVADQNTALNLYQSNQVDIAEINRDQVQQYKGKPDLTTTPELFSYFLEFNEKTVPAFKNANIRKALTLAIDRQGFVDTILGNGSTPATGLVPTGTADGNGGEFRKTAGDTEPKFSVDDAKKYLAQGLKELGLTQFPKITMISDDDETSKKSAEFIQAAFKQNLGIDMDVQSVPKKLRLQKQTNLDYQLIAPDRWGADYNDPMTFLDMWVTGNSMNTVAYSNPEYDKLVNAAQTEANPQKRTDEMVQAEKVLMNDMPVGPIYYLSRAYLKRPSVTGLVFPLTGGQFEFKYTSIK